MRRWEEKWRRRGREGGREGEERDTKDNVGIEGDLSLSLSLSLCLSLNLTSRSLSLILFIIYHFKSTESQKQLIPTEEFIPVFQNVS